MINITASLLQAAVGCTAERAAEVAPHIAAACATYSIDTPQRLAAFLAQVGHESGSFRYTTEIWKPTAAQLTYQGRMGNTDPGDGERFKGHGFLQITGRNNHVRVRGRLRARLGPDVPDFEAEPERLADLQWAAMSAADYWGDRGLNAIADSGDFDKLSDLINIGHATATSGDANGYADRLARYKRAQQAIAAAEGRVVQVPAEKHAATPAAPATQQPETSVMAPFIALALPAILEAVPKLASLFSSGSAVSQRNEAAATTVVNIAKTAINAANEQDLVEKLQNDPAAAATVQKAMEDNWFEIHEAAEKSVAAAREFVTTYTAQKDVRTVAGAFTFPELLSLIFVIISACGAGIVLLGEDYSAEIKGAVITLMLIAGYTGVREFWFGSSPAEQAKVKQVDAMRPPPQ